MANVVSSMKYLFIFFAMIYPMQGIQANPGNSQLKVVASFSILGDLVRQIGAEDVIVDVIVPENTDPHVYQPKPLDVKKLSQAELVFVNGLGFEGWFNRLITNSGYKGELVIAAKSVIPRILHNSIGGDVEDPHAWHNVKNAILYVQEIKLALQKKLPIKKDAFEIRAQQYINSLKRIR